MEYVILAVGLAAVGAAWDGARRAIGASSAKQRSDEELAELRRRVDHIESSHLVTRNRLTEMTNFMSAAQRKR